MLSLFGEKFSAKCIKKFYQDAVTPKITNNWYEGEVTRHADRLNILTVGLETSAGAEVTALQDYSVGTPLTLHVIRDSEAQVIPNQRKAYYFEIDSVNKYESYVDDAKENILDQQYSMLTEEVDAFVLGDSKRPSGATAGTYGVASGNQVGTDYSTGTVVVVVTSGAVTGTNTVFTAAMVGRGFKATGHTKWYRIISRSSATAIVIDDDLDDTDTGQYTGGAIAAGTAYVISGATKVQVAYNTLYGKILDLKQKLDEAKAPKINRSLTVNSAIANLLLQTTELIPAVATAYEEKVLNGRIGRLAGMDVYETEQVAGNNSDGYRIIANHISWCTFANGFVESTIEEDIKGEFGKAYKGLDCYGAKVIDERRKMAAELFCYI